MKKVLGFLTALMVLSNIFGGVAAQETPLFEGYLSRGEAVLVGPLIVTLTDTQKDYGSGDYYAFLLIMKDGRILNAEYKTILVPDPQRIRRLLLDPEFLLAMAKTQGYDVTQCKQYVNNTAEFNACLISTAYGFYQWLNSASPKEIGEAVVKTIEEHPELEISKKDILMEITYPDITPVREGETVEVNVDNRTVYVTVNEIYPNGARISISGPPEWRAATAPGMLISSVEMPSTVQPGDTVTVKVHLRNEGALKVRYINLFVTPTPMSFNDSSSIASAVSMALSQSGVSQNVFYPEGSAVQYIEYLEGKENATLTFRIKINPNADVGTYPLYVGAVYFTGLGANMRMVQSYNFVALTVKKPREAFVEITKVETEPMGIEPGDAFTVRFTLENTGAEPVKALSLKISSYKVPVQGEIKNVDLSALSQLPIQGGEQLSGNLQDTLNQIMAQLAKQNMEAFLPIGEDNVKYVAELQPGEKATLEFRIKANDRLENGIYPLRIELKYLTGPNEKEITDERLVGIEITGKEHLVISKVSTSPSTVLAGTNNVEVNIEVENVGTGSARYVLLKPNPVAPFELAETSQQLINLGSLAQGDSAKATFRVNVAEDAEGGAYEIPVKIEYVDASGANRELELDVPIIVKEKPKIEIEGVRFDREPLQGEDVTVYVKLKNVGGEQAENVIIEGVVKADQPFTLVKRTDYIGNLDPGQSGEGALVISVARDALPKDYTIQVRVRAVGDKESGDDNVYVFEKSITIQVKENTKTKSNLRNLAIVIGALVVIAVVYTYRKRSG